MDNDGTSSGRRKILRRATICHLSLHSCGNRCDVTFNSVSQLVDPKSFAEGKKKKIITRQSERECSKDFSWPRSFRPIPTERVELIGITKKKEICYANRFILERHALKVAFFFSSFSKCSASREQRRMNLHFPHICLGKQDFRCHIRPSIVFYISRIIAYDSFVRYRRIFFFFFFKKGLTRRWIGL